MSASNELADYYDTLELTVAYQDAEIDRLSQAIQQIIWTSSGWCRFCNSQKPAHTAGCHIRKVLFKDVVWKELTHHA